MAALICSVPHLPTEPVTPVPAGTAQYLTRALHLSMALHTRTRSDVLVFSTQVGLALHPVCRLWFLLEYLHHPHVTVRTGVTGFKSPTMLCIFYLSHLMAVAFFLFLPMFGAIYFLGFCFTTAVGLPITLVWLNVSWLLCLIGFTICIFNSAEHTFNCCPTSLG